MWREEREREEMLNIPLVDELKERRRTLRMRVVAQRNAAYAGDLARRHPQQHINHNNIHTMKLLTHNMLICNKKGCTENNFPLKIEATTVDKREFEFQPDFIRRMLATLSWSALVSAAKDVCAPFLSYLLPCLSLIPLSFPPSLFLASLP